MATPVGVSELPGRTFGKMQVMTKTQAAWNLIAAIAELKRDYGEIATVNEADRSRPDQLFMRGEYLAGRGPLAAYCSLDPRPEGTYTSTHDPGNHGDGADLGGPGGSVLSVRAHNLLDGNHPDGVLGRKYGLFNTGAFFYVPEWWHFNIYPGRAEVLAPNPDTIVEPAPEPTPSTEENDMKTIIVVDADGKGYWVLVTATGDWKISGLTVNGRKFEGSQVLDYLQVLEQSTPAKPAMFNKLSFAVLRAALRKAR